MIFFFPFCGCVCKSREKREVMKRQKKEDVFVRQSGRKLLGEKCKAREYKWEVVKVQMCNAIDWGPLPNNYIMFFVFMYWHGI